MHTKDLYLLVFLSQEMQVDLKRNYLDNYIRGGKISFRGGFGVTIIPKVKKHYKLNNFYTSNNLIEYSMADYHCNIQAIFVAQ